MSRRIDIELTSHRDDGSLTWRAAGARQPKGVVDASLVPGRASVGAVLRAEIETTLDGTEVLSLQEIRDDRAGPERIEVLGAGDDSELVTTSLAPKKERKPRSKAKGKDRDRSRGPRGGDRSGGRDRGGKGGRNHGGGDRSRSPGRDAEKAPPSRPKPKRLRAKRTHRNAALADLAAEERPVAEQVLRGGVPAVRQAVAKQNEAARAQGHPEVKAQALVDLAEKLLPRLRGAEWRDRAEAALADLDELDLRDLRSVVVAAEQGARDDETRAMATQLREGLDRRVAEEQQAWLTEITEALDAGRVVRALRLSSRPPKAGTPLPPELTERLITGTRDNLTSDTPQDRWATVIDALSFSPVHLKVDAPSLPDKPKDELLGAVRKARKRVPQIASQFGFNAGNSATGTATRDTTATGDATAAGHRSGQAPGSG